MGFSYLCFITQNVVFFDVHIINFEVIMTNSLSEAVDVCEFSSFKIQLGLILYAT